jgi:hypothetical protein
MIKKLITLLIIITFVTTVYAAYPTNTLIQPDKYAHIACHAFLAQYLRDNTELTFWEIVLLSNVIGLAKEYADHLGNGKAEVGDIIANNIGVVTPFVWSVVIK